MVKYSKPSLFIEVTFLSNPMNSKTMMCKIKALKEKYGEENHTYQNMIIYKLILNKQGNIFVMVIK
jgi:hypothetical protein